MSETHANSPKTMKAPTALVSPTAERLAGIDRLRGLVIVLMALDHVRDFFEVDALRFSPTDLNHTYSALFFTRFITHFCAPTFVLLAGVSAFLHGVQLQNRAAQTRFLLTRGLWLIALDVFVISPVWPAQFGIIELGTLWAIGCGMIALAGLHWLSSTRVALAVGGVIVVAHNLLDSVHASAFGAYGPFWSLLHEQGPLPLGLEGKVHYPALPWIGVIAVGYGLGPLFVLPAERRARLLQSAGAAAIALFLLLRGLNLYGDPAPWSGQETKTLTVLSFLNVTKYPPSLLYVLVTLGPVLMLLPAMERLDGAVSRVLTVFGRTPLFFYVAHLYAMVVVYAALMLASGSPPENLRVGLAAAYVAWAALVAALFPVCRWFAGVKRRRPYWWVGYL
ncbi:MAG: heparan-alpha-glucosaminide N-acetyltransferase domain-containing protein [Methylocystis sp.]